MKNFLLLLVILPVLANVSSAQDWAPFPFGQKSFYIYPHTSGYGINEPFQGMYVSHDEVIPTGNLGALLFNRHQTGINCLDSFNAFSYFAQGAMRPLPDSVHVVQGTDSVRLYVGGHLKAFRTASPVSAGYTIVASLESVLGTMDSIKTFTSSSDTFVLSKSFGLLFYRGPGLDADSLPVKLIGAKRHHNIRGGPIFP
jgi:hypothetical protein